jgi:ubiquinone/menaquinone biosynthesis C-methylase UbiE
MKAFEQLMGDKYVTGDIESPLAKVKLDIHEIPFEDHSFDLVFCNHVLEHVRDDHQAMKEMYRILKPGGWGILMIPHFFPLPERTYEDPTITEPKEREKAFGQDDHLRLYGKDYPLRLEKAGFQVEAIPYAQKLDREQVDRYALPEDEIIYKVVKPPLNRA